MGKLVINNLIPILLLQALLLALLVGAKTSSSGGHQSSSGQQQQQSGKSGAASGLARSGSVAANFISALAAVGGLIPGLVTNVAPLLALVGLGALMMPALGLGNAMNLLRESRRSASDFAGPQPMGGNQNFNLNQHAFGQFARPMQSSAQDVYYFTQRSLPSLAYGLQEVFERVGRAMENAGKSYN